MRSLGLSDRLRTAFAEFVDAAAAVLRAEVAGGAEVPFELATYRGRPGAQATLYCYQPLTRAYITERQEELARLAEHAAAAGMLQGLSGLDRYLASRGLAPDEELGPERITAADMRPSARMRPLPGDPRAAAALRELLADVFEGQSDFDPRPERVAEALARLERAALAGASETVTLVATLHGLTIASGELALAKGLTVAVADALSDLPEAARASAGGPGDHLVVALVLEVGEGGEGQTGRGPGDEAAAVARGCGVLADLLRALRLFGDGRVAFGELAWVRAGGEDGRWRPFALGAGRRPSGMLVVTAEQEDELRAFCELVSRRTPHANRFAWALRRFELGCERPSAGEGLSDHLLALRALLEPEGPATGLLAARVAALCATPERRPELDARITRALELERALIAGGNGKRTRDQAIAKDVADHLRALLRDVICGHLDPELVPLADRLLVTAEQSSGGEAAAQEEQPAKS
jgi:hypothetical protein